MNRELNTAVVPSEWETYIPNDLKRLQGFGLSGHRSVHEELLPIVRERKISRGTALELGCGLGRLAFPLAAHFQTVIGADIAAEMVRRAQRFASLLLCDNGAAYFRFAIRPASLAYHLKCNVLDFLLPRFCRRGIRRIRRSPAEIEECLREAGLQIVSQWTPCTELHRYILCKAARGTI